MGGRARPRVQNPNIFVAAVDRPFACAWLDTAYDLRILALSRACFPLRRFPFAVSTWLLLCGAVLAACSGASADFSPRGGGADAGDAGAAGSENEPQSIELSFDPAGTITLKPKEPRELTVRATLGDG